MRKTGCNFHKKYFLLQECAEAAVACLCCPPSFPLFPLCDIHTHVRSEQYLCSLQGSKQALSYYMRGKFPKLGKGVSDCFVGGSAAMLLMVHHPTPTPIYSFPSVLILFFTLQAAAYKFRGEIWTKITGLLGGITQSSNHFGRSTGQDNQTT